MADISGIQPSIVWRHFNDICQIPRPSKHEQKIRAHIISKVESWGLEYIEDEIGNIIVSKPATLGLENAPVVVLQSHVDMVPQKNEGVAHDFLNDPIVPYEENGWVKATETTLGSDNGMGLAAALAILESAELKHGPVEALFTVDEEAGMSGAFALKPGLLKADIMFNLDSEDEGEMCIGCAGGLDAVIEFNLDQDTSGGFKKFFRIDIKGFKGGHSGVDIDLGRGNAVLALIRVLIGLDQDKFRIGHIQGGNLRNAIPRESHAILACQEQDYPYLVKAMQSRFDQISSELKLKEGHVNISFNENQNTLDKVFNQIFQQRVLGALAACPNGVLRMSDVQKGMVETSNNVASIRMSEETLEVTCLMRSSTDSAKEYVGQQITSLFNLAGAHVRLEGGYPGWAPLTASPTVEKARKVYKDLFNKDLIINVIHAGLECGIIGANYPDLDMVSFGPTIKYPHSPDEMVDVSSVDKFWQFLTALLQEIAN